MSSVDTRLHNIVTKQEVPAASAQHGNSLINIIYVFGYRRDYSKSLTLTLTMTRLPRLSSTSTAGLHTSPSILRLKSVSILG